MLEYQQQIANLEGDCRELRSYLQVGITYLDQIDTWGIVEVKAVEVSKVNKVREDLTM